MSGFEEFQRRGRQRRSHTGGYVFGILVILVGTVMLLNTLGVIDARSLWDYVPLVLIVLGFTKAIDRVRPASLALGAVFVAVGTLWFLDNIAVIDFSKRILIPLFIIALGFVALVRAVERQWLAQPDAPVKTDDDVSLWTMFGGIKRVITSPEFRGGDAFAMFGGIELDLRRADLVDGAIVDTNVIFGGVEIKVPLSWNVDVKGVAILGGFEDKTNHPSAGQPCPTLIVTGFAVFGGVSVMNG
jgi:hypothetical protein